MYASYFSESGENAPVRLGILGDMHLKYNVFIPSSVTTCLNMLDMKLLPKSDCITLGNPTNVKKNDQMRYNFLNFDIPHRNCFRKTSCAAHDC